MQAHQMPLTLLTRCWSSPQAFLPGGLSFLCSSLHVPAIRSVDTLSYCSHLVLQCLHGSPIPDSHLARWSDGQPSSGWSQPSASALAFIIHLQAPQKLDTHPPYESFFFLSLIYLDNLYTQCRAQSHDPEIKSQHFFD